MEIATIKDAIPDLEILGLLGEGAKCSVFKARRRQLGDLVAIKLLSEENNDQKCIERFISEARRTAALKHPNIVSVHSCGFAASGRPYIMMEYIEGESLRDALAKGKQFSADQLQQIFSDVLTGLACAHEVGLLHRDLKPANIMLLEKDGRIGAKLVDFGLAKPISDEGGHLTESGVLLGTPLYMSPEQCMSGQLSVGSDLYSIACVVYECIAGTPLFSGVSSIDAMYKHVNSSISPAELEKVCGKSVGKALARALSKDPSQRPLDAAEFRMLLEIALSDAPLKHVKEGQVAEVAAIAFIMGILVGALSMWSFGCLSNSETESKISASFKAGADSRVRLQSLTKQAEAAKQAVESKSRHAAEALAGVVSSNLEYRNILYDRELESEILSARAIGLRLEIKDGKTFDESVMKQSWKDAWKRVYDLSVMIDPLGTGKRSAEVFDEYCKAQIKMGNGDMVRPVLASQIDRLSKESPNAASLPLLKQLQLECGWSSQDHNSIDSSGR